MNVAIPSKPDAALAFVRSGYAVASAQAGTKGVRTALKMSTQESARVKAHWDHCPNDNIVVDTSRPCANGLYLVVLDIDTKQAARGPETLREHEHEHGTLPADAYRQRSPSGGEHIFLYSPHPVQGGNGKFGPGIDVQAGGRIVMGAGSEFDGKPYLPDARGIRRTVMAPQWVLDKLSHATEAAPARAKEKLEGVDDENARRRGALYLELEATPAIEGQAGDKTTYETAARLKDIGLDADAALDLMLELYNPRSRPHGRRMISLRRSATPTPTARTRRAQRPQEAVFPAACGSQEHGRPGATPVRQVQRRIRLHHDPR